LVDPSLWLFDNPRIGRELSMICQSCGVEAPTQKVLFVQHIGAVVMFFHKRIGGLFCRNCVNKYFGEYSLMTLFLGWWGLISVFATPVVLMINVANYFRAWTLPPVPVDAIAPRLTDEAIGRLQPVTSEIIDRLNRNEPLRDVAASIGARVSVTPGQVIRYVEALVAQARGRN
jgi:hypothetical protein